MRLHTSAYIIMYHEIVMLIYALVYFFKGFVLSLFHLEVESYRAFRDKAQVEFKPLTLLYGYNQAGKSTLLRLLPLLADSIHGNQGPLALTSPAVPSLQIRELGWLGQSHSLTPKIKLMVEQDNIQALTLQFADENGLIVNRLSLTEGIDDKFSADWSATSRREGGRVSGMYEGRVRGKDWNGELNFDSFFPKGLPEEVTKMADAVKCACAPLERLQWLRANRIDGGVASQSARCCRPDGSDLVQQIRGNNEKSILQSVSSWLAKQERLGSEVKIDQGTGQFVIGAEGRGNLPLYLSGEGLRSLLPMLICAAWADCKDDRAPTMLAIEEPESHLHPHLQVALFDRLVDSVNNGIPVVLETHSVYLLRAMQLAILQKRLSPEQVGLYWVDQALNGVASVQSIDVQANATLINWRPDVFEKEQDLAHQIMELRWQQRGNN